MRQRTFIFEKNNQGFCAIYFKSAEFSSLNKTYIMYSFKYANEIYKRTPTYLLLSGWVRMV